MELWTLKFRTKFKVPKESYQWVFLALSLCLFQTTELQFHLKLKWDTIWLKIRCWLLMIVKDICMDITKEESQGWKIKLLLTKPSIHQEIWIPQLMEVENLSNFKLALQYLMICSRWFLERIKFKLMFHTISSKKKVSHLILHQLLLIQLFKVLLTLLDMMCRLVLDS